MIQVRNGVFETNSSTSHSLVILNKATEYYTPEEAWNEIKFDCWHDEYKPSSSELSFNRYPFQVLGSFESKLRYLYAHAPSRRLKKKSKHGYTQYVTQWYRVTNVVRKFIPQFPSPHFRRGDIWKECPSSEALGLLASLKKHGISWIEFLTCKSIVVICDGDEYALFYKMEKLDLINKSTIKEMWSID